MPPSLPGLHPFGAGLHQGPLCGRASGERHQAHRRRPAWGQETGSPCRACVVDPTELPTFRESGALWQRGEGQTPVLLLTASRGCEHPLLVFCLNEKCVFLLIQSYVFPRNLHRCRLLFCTFLYFSCIFALSVTFPAVHGFLPTSFFPTVGHWGVMGDWDAGDLFPLWPLPHALPHHT